MSKFAVGEIAIISMSRRPEYPVGSEVLIVEVCGPTAKCPNWPAFAQYRIEPQRCLYPIYANDKCLRKRPPKQDWVKLCNLTDLPANVVPV